VYQKLQSRHKVSENGITFFICVMHDKVVIINWAVCCCNRRCTCFYSL